MGVVEAVGAAVDRFGVGDRVVIPFNISCGHCCMCDKGLMSSARPPRCVNTARGRRVLGYTKLYGQVAGGQAEYLRVPQAQFGPIKVPEGRPTTGSSTSPTCCLPRGRQ